MSFKAPLDTPDLVHSAQTSLPGNLFSSVQLCGATWSCASKRLSKRLLALGSTGLRFKLPSVTWFRGGLRGGKLGPGTLVALTTTGFLGGKAGGGAGKEFEEALERRGAWLVDVEVVEEVEGVFGREGCGLAEGEGEGLSGLRRFSEAADEVGESPRNSLLLLSLSARRVDRGDTDGLAGMNGLVVGLGCCCCCCSNCCRRCFTESTGSSVSVIVPSRAVVVGG